jgi:TRAP-type C4-dicarboxylate transport system substrate-binding protein
MENIFEFALRNKLRFNYRGLITVEDLWDLGAQGLDYIYKGLMSEKRQTETESLIEKKTENTMLEAKDANLVCLGAFSQGMRCVMTTEVAVRQASDLQGIKCRVPESSLYVDTMTALGTIPTPIPSSELYSALSSGIVAGYENDPATAVNRNLHEVLNYYSKTNHFAALNTMMIAKNVYESLPAEYQTILTEVMAEACKNQIQERAAQSEDFLKIMEEEGGMEIIDLDASVIEDLKALVAQMKEEFVKANGVEDIYADLLEQLAQ